MKSLHNSASTVCLRSSTGRRGVVRRAQTNPVEMPHKSLFVRTHHWVEILGPESQNIIVTMVTSRLTWPKSCCTHLLSMIPNQLTQDFPQHAYVSHSHTWCPFITLTVTKQFFLIKHQACFQKEESGQAIDSTCDAGTTIMSQRAQYAETINPALVLAASCSLQAVEQAVDWFPKFFLLEMQFPFKGTMKTKHKFGPFQSLSRHSNNHDNLNTNLKQLRQAIKKAVEKVATH